MKRYSRFKKKHRIVHIAIVAVTIVIFWWAVWGLLDTFLLPNSPVLGYLSGILIAFLILYLDDFHLKELE